MKPKILIIYTGGTIGMIENQITGALEPFDFDHLIDNVPKVKMLDYVIENIQFENPLDSSDMNPQHWCEIARHIELNYELFDGFVVLHGTDTMAYTASALSFMLENLHKPVIITGSQLPIGEVRTDGEENLITALQIAASVSDNGSPTVQEVAILFENYLWRGNRATKMSADNFNAFKSNNYPSLAKIGLGIHFNPDALMSHRAMRPLQVRCKMDPRVMFLDLHPGMDERTLRHLLATPDIKGIVLKTFGAGNGPTEKWFIDAIGDACDRGLVIVNVSQCVNGGVHAKRYVGANLLDKAGVVSGYDITSEAAITKLMYLFGVGLEPEEVKQYLIHPLAGEMTIEP
ncbi:MAG: asparaginase [Muribaculaceae bacterium]|nr:asparaginase [Muribaculaceae bacterium]